MSGVQQSTKIMEEDLGEDSFTTRSLLQGQNSTLINIEQSRRAL